MTCKDCIHTGVCVHQKELNDFEVNHNCKCPDFKNKSKWISVEDKLPEKDGFYLVYAKSYNAFIPDVYIQEYVQGIGFTHDGYLIDNSVTHWMPLPEPPKEREKH